MKVEELRIGQKIKHPQYGIGEVKAITEQSVDIQFSDLKRTIAPPRTWNDFRLPAEPATTSTLEASRV